MLADLSASKEKLADIGIKKAGSDTLQHLAHISDESMKAIVEIAVGKYKEDRYLDSLALFSLLSTLNTSEPEYLFRLGIAAQKSNKIELASRAYAAAIELDSTNVGARLFAAECLINLNLHEKAKTEIDNAKEIMKNNKTDQIWLDFLHVLESIVKP